MYNVAKFARSLIREFGRKDEKTVAILWINKLSSECRDGYMEYFYYLLSSIYHKEQGFKQEYVHEHVCRVFNCYPKVINSHKYPSFYLESDNITTDSHIKFLQEEIDTCSDPIKLKSLKSDCELLKSKKNLLPSLTKRVCAVDSSGNINVRYMGLEVPFNYNPCEANLELVGASAISIINWRIVNPLPTEDTQKIKKFTSKPLSNISRNDSSGWGSYYDEL